MADSSRTSWISGSGFVQRGLILSGSMALIGTVLVFAPILPRPSLLQTLAPPAAPRPHTVTSSSWTGHLENPPAKRAYAAQQRLTSASYTTGFDAENFAPLPRTPVKIVARDTSACPAGLSCTFRPRQTKALALPPPRPQAFTEMASATAEEHGQETARTGFAALLPRLPSTNTLLTPFSFVATSVGGLMRRL